MKISDESLRKEVWHGEDVHFSHGLLLLLFLLKLKFLDLVVFAPVILTANNSLDLLSISLSVMCTAV
jgi:hypothetical protein